MCQCIEPLTRAIASWVDLSCFCLSVSKLPLDIKAFGKIVLDENVMNHFSNAIELPLVQ